MNNKFNGNPRAQGLYSPENERQFRATYGKICSAQSRPLPHTVGFADSDFAGDTLTLRSTSGSILYHRGTPLVWSAKRQGLRASSTCEAEYIALHDTIRLSQNQGFLSWYLEEGSLPLVFCDNQSALALAKPSIVAKT